jgi:hypothetical protein
MSPLLPHSLLILLPWLMAGVIAFRCFMVLHGMNWKERRCSVLLYWLFGASYITLMIASIGAAIHITQGEGITGDWLFLMASSGMILCDRRRRRKMQRAGVAA